MGSGKRSQRDIITKEQSGKRQRHSSRRAAQISRESDEQPATQHRHQHQHQHQRNLHFNRVLDNKYSPGREGELGHEHMSNGYHEHEHVTPTGPMHPLPGVNNGATGEQNEEALSATRASPQNGRNRPGRTKQSVLTPPRENAQNAAGGMQPSTRNNVTITRSLPLFRSQQLSAKHRDGRDTDVGTRRAAPAPKPVPSPTIKPLADEKKPMHAETFDSPPRRTRARNAAHENTNDTVANDRGVLQPMDSSQAGKATDGPPLMFNQNRYFKYLKENEHAKQEPSGPPTENSVVQTQTNKPSDKTPEQSPNTTTPVTEMWGSSPSRAANANTGNEPNVEEEVLSEGDGGDTENMVSVIDTKNNANSTENDVECLRPSDADSIRSGKPIRSRNVALDHARGLGSTSNCTSLKRRRSDSKSVQGVWKGSHVLQAPPIFKPRPPARQVPSKTDLDLDIGAIKEVFEHFLAEQMGIVTLSSFGLTTKIVSDVITVECDKLGFIQEVQLEDNLIDSIPYELRTTVELITNLDIKRNYISGLPNWFYDACANKMRTLLLQHNTISILPEGIQQLSQLETLNVSYNQLESLPSGLGELEKLRYLNVAGNKLTKLPEKLGFSNKSLICVDISYNYEYATAIPGSFEACLHTIEHFFFHQTKLFESFQRKPDKLPTHDLLIKLMNITDEQINEGWKKSVDKREKAWLRKQAQ